MRQFFTIRNKGGLDWNTESKDFESSGTLFPTSMTAYNLAVEMTSHNLRIIFHNNVGGSVKTSTVWESK